MKKQPDTQDSASPFFIAQHRDSIIGTLEGLDRVRLRATLPSLYYLNTMEAYLCAARVLWKHFKAFAITLTNRIKLAAMLTAKELGRPWQYISSSVVRKETIAREIARRDGIKEGLIAVLTCVEPCRTYHMRGNGQTKKLELKLELGKCQHFYFYRIDPQFGFMHVRLQPWFPFQVQVCINGREWLARQMDAQGIGYVRQDNCFTQLEDVAKAQELMDAQIKVNWSRELERILRENHPLAAEICRPLGLSYYWSVESSEYALDIMFRNRASLASIYPRSGFIRVNA